MRQAQAYFVVASHCSGDIGAYEGPEREMKKKFKDIKTKDNRLLDWVYFGEVKEKYVHQR